MKNQTKTVDFFFSTNAANGFFSLASALDEPIVGERRFLIKGSAGSGKSTAMKKAVSACLGKEVYIEQIHCSFDPDSLDGVLLPNAHCSIVDATPPHVVEPHFPASFQTVCDLWSTLDESVLEPRLPQLAELEQNLSRHHGKCRRLLACADRLLLENRHVAERCTDFSKVERFAKRLAARSFPTIGQEGLFRDRLLSAFTMHGVLTYTNTPKTMCERTILLDDPFGLVADRILRILADEAKTGGYTVYRCPHPLMPDRFLAAVLVPEVSLAFLAKNSYTPWTGYPAERVIHYTRFTDCRVLQSHRQSMRFLQKAADSLLASAADELKAGKLLHDRLEDLYRDAIDFALVDLRTKKLLEKIESRY